MTSYFESTTSSTTSSTSSVTDKLGTSLKVAVSEGIPQAGLEYSAEASVSTEYTTTAEMNTEESYVESRYYGTTKSETVSRSVTLTVGNTYLIASWGAELTALANYTVEYAQYLRGTESSSTVVEDITLTNKDLAGTPFFVPRSTADGYSYDDLKEVAFDCDALAEAYLTNTGIFSEYAYSDSRARHGLRGSSRN